MRVGPNEMTIKLQNAAFSIVEYRVDSRVDAAACAAVGEVPDRQ